MNYTEKELDVAKQDAVWILSKLGIGRSCGLTYAEIKAIERYICDRAEKFLAHIEDPEIALDPRRIAFLGFVQLRKERVVWYKPWIESRFRQISQRYVNWWETQDETAGVARQYIPDSFAV